MKANNKKKATILFLQLVAFMHLWRTEVNAEMVEGCVQSKLTLTCNEAKVINISRVVLGDSPGCPDTKCCPRHNHCTAKPNDNHVNEVHRRCNGQQRCVVNVIHERIPCESTAFVNHRNDFERITYDCINNGRSTTDAFKATPSTDFHADKTKTTTSRIEHYTAETEYTSVTETSISEDALTSDEPVMLNGTESMPIIIAIVCLLVLIIIIVLIIVIVKRKKLSSKTKSEVEMTDVRNGQNGIYVNQIQDTNGNSNSSALRQNEGQGQNCSSTTCEEPNNVVEYTIVSQETSPAAEGAGADYCSSDVIKSGSQTLAAKPDDDGYSLAGHHDNRQSTCVENVYEDVESKQSDIKAKSGNIRNDGRAYDEPKKVGVQAVSSGQRKLQLECRPYSKSDISVSKSKADEGIYKNIGEVVTPSSPSSPYEPMTPILSQNIYANELAVPFRTESLTSSSGCESEAHSPYCEMRSPSIKFKDDGVHMLFDNELYSQ